MYPQVHYTASQDRRIMNEGSQRYMCVQSDNNNSPGLLSTTTLNDMDDAEVEFSLHYFSTARINDSKMVLIVHKATGSCLSFSGDKLTLRRLNDDCPNSNTSAAADPRSITTADCRFFYIHSSGRGERSYVIRPTNGTDGNLYLSINDNGVALILKPFGGRTFPSEFRFSLRK